MRIHLKDLHHDLLHWNTVDFDHESWGRLMETVRSLSLVDAETLNRLVGSVDRFEVTQEQARKIGNGLEVWLIKDLTKKATPPVIPSYIVPIAASNGVWIDPALPLLHREREFPMDLVRLTSFCLNCSGFSVN